jgi:hypothetical protein
VPWRSLERRDVLVEERTGLRLGRLGNLIGGRGQFPQPRAGALQRALDRHRRCPEHDRDLGGGKGKYVPQHQDRALPGRKELQAGDERQPQSLARRDDGGGISRVRGHHRIRRRLQPVHLCPGTFR